MMFRLRVALAVLGVGLLVGGCTGAGTEPATPPEPDREVVRPEPPEERAPVVLFAPAAEERRTPASITQGQLALARELAGARKVLHKVVDEEGRDPNNPWAVSHAMLALGADLELKGGAKAVDHLFAEYAEAVDVGGTSLVTFPASRGRIRVEPHTDLLLKALAEGGVSPDREVTVEGKRTTVAALYRHSLWRAWIVGTQTGFRSGNFNDAPWALQGLAAWAPPGLAWTAKGGRVSSMTDLTHRLVDVLDQETAEMQAAMDAGLTMKKDTRRGLFRYTCGGQHLLQGVAYSVARGHGAGGDREKVCRQLDVLRWRIDVELNTIDPIIAEGERELKIVLLGQRLKFLGHSLETVHKIGALGLCELDQAQVAASQRVARELVATVNQLGELGVWSDLDGLRKDQKLARWRREGGAEQVYLDFVGDAAHAVRGIDLATGKGAIRL